MNNIVRGLAALAAAFVAVFGWHLWLARDLTGVMPEAKPDADLDMSVSVNPLTDVVNIVVIDTPPQVSSGPFASLGTSLAMSMFKLMEPAATIGLNKKARSHFDLYAVLVPYEARVTVQAPDAATLARIRARQLERKRVEDEKKKAEMQELLKGLGLEGIIVRETTSAFGVKSMGVFGTIVNNGSQTFERVVVRVYFLDASGKRIGEHDIYPVSVSTISFGDDNAPLRPGYRKDFGYAMRDAPSGWANKVETEIVEAKPAL